MELITIIVLSPGLEIHLSASLHGLQVYILMQKQTIRIEIIYSLRKRLKSRFIESVQVVSQQVTRSSDVTRLLESLYFRTYWRRGHLTQLL